MGEINIEHWADKTLLDILPPVHYILFSLKWGFRKQIIKLFIFEFR